jgi:GTP pyrophosphokinase
MSEANVSYEECLANVQSYIHEPKNLDLISRAYAFAHEHHAGQFRKNGDPYEVHVIAVANTLAKLHCEPVTIAAGLLHDTIEDCDGVDEQMITDLFGKEVTMLVEAVTKVGKAAKQSEKEYQALNHTKIFSAASQDIRVIIIKLADRLHNMRTLQYMKPEKQKKISEETLHVYAPIAHTMGMGAIKRELEDLSFYYLNPIKYHEIEAMLLESDKQREAHIQRIVSDMEIILREKNIPFRIHIRHKHPYAVYKKMQTHHLHFDEIFDKQVIRIITTSSALAYRTISYIHYMYVPIQGHFKDYMAKPKANMYQALHTTIVDPTSGQIFEFQVRSEKSDEVAQYGVAAEWKFDESLQDSGKFSKKSMESKFSWLRDFNALTLEEKQNPIEYMNVIQNDMFNANIFVMTPHGKYIHLPADSTPIDFAYRIHSEIGNHAVAAKINGRRVALNTPLESGNMVQIITSNDSPGPRMEWLQFVKTKLARNKIHAYYAALESKGLVQDGNPAANLPVEAESEKDIKEILLAGCCTPVYGDEIIGVLSKNQTLKIHRKDCQALKENTGEIVHVHWNENVENRRFYTNVQISSEDRAFLVSDICLVCQQLDVQIKEIHSKASDNFKEASTFLKIGVKNLIQLEHLLGLLGHIEKVRSVKRI